VSPPEWVKGCLAAVVLVACGRGAASAERGGHRVVTLLHLADLHSHLLAEPFAPRARDRAFGLGGDGDTVLAGGVARIATVLDEQRSRADVAVTLDAGDVMEGTAFFTYFGGVPELRAQGALGVDAAALGNHDVAAGSERLAALRREWVTFPLVAANLPEELGSGLVAPATTLERGGVRVAVIGIGRSPDHAPALAAVARAVQGEVDALSAGVDLVVALSHLGSELDVALVPRLAGVDVVLGGHTHDVLSPPRAVLDCGVAVASALGCTPRPVLVVHSGAYGRYVGVVDAELSADPADLEATDGRARAVVNVSSRLVPVSDSVPERPDVAALLEPYRRALVERGIDEPFAFAPAAVTRASASGGDSALGNFVAGAMLDAAGAELAVVNSTGLRADLLPFEVTPADLFRVLPFDDELVTLNLSGREVARAMQAVQKASCDRGRRSQVQVAGAGVSFDCTGEARVSVGGAEVAPDSRYRVAAPSFLTEPGQWLDASRVGSPEPSGVTVRDAVAAFMRAREPCKAPENTKDLPCVDRAAGALVDGRIDWR
jgi:5'-nucleotidase / UDP-sugar diphosphatase